MGLGLLLFAGLVATGFIFSLRHENKRRDRGETSFVGTILVTIILILGSRCGLRAHADKLVGRLSV